MGKSEHLFENTIFEGEKAADAQYAMVMVHGRGDDATKMQQLVKQLHLPEKTAIVYPIATNNTWYPTGFMKDWAENQPWLDSALENLDNIIIFLNQKGIPTQHIFLLGFSQGACLTIEYATRNATKYAGIAVLSGGLIGPRIEESHYQGNFQQTEVLIGCSDVDHHIPENRLHETESVITPMGAIVDKRIYPGMDHIINEDEIEKVNDMLSHLNESK